MEIVKRAIAAVNERDIDGYLGCCTEDIQLQTPVSPVAGVYEGADGIRRFFADIEDAGPDFRLDLERWKALAGSESLPSCAYPFTGAPAACPPRLKAGTSMSSRRARSGAFKSSSTGPTPSKPPDCRSRRCRRRTSRS